MKSRQASHEALYLTHVARLGGVETQSVRLCSGGGKTRAECGRQRKVMLTRSSQTADAHAHCVLPTALSRSHVDTHPERRKVLLRVPQRCGLPAAAQCVYEVELVQPELKATWGAVV
jgi:hypothetical protein